jgi:predicted Zn-dependent protease
MNRTRALGLMAALSLAAAPAFAGTAKKFEWTSRSADARKMLEELQARIEAFQFGAANIELARKMVAADPQFAMGQYYLSAVLPGPEAEPEYQKARELARSASDGERRFIEGMRYVRLNQGVDFAKSIQPLQALTEDYPGERFVHVILGQLLAGDNRADEAAAAFRKAQALGSSPRVEAFLAGDDLMKGRYAQARATYLSVEKSLPKGSAPFAVRYGITFSHLYEGDPEAAVKSLETYLGEYKSAGLDQQFPEVFIWNSIARIRLESGQLEAAMKAYEAGYQSIPRSNLPEDQKRTWLGRLHHGKCRTLARMGKHAEAWGEAETVRNMIVEAGEAGRQYWPAYHYLAGYAKLEAGDAASALEHLLQADQDDPFQTLLLGRAYERVGRKDEAKAAYKRVIDSQAAGIERALAFPEARKKLSAS